MPDLTSTTVTTSTLKVPILLENGKSITINVPDPINNLTKNDLALSSSEKGFAGYLVNENLIVTQDAVMAVEVGDPFYYNTEKIIFD